MLKLLYFYFACFLLSATCMETNGQMLIKNKPIKYLALGDSYTIGESVAEVQRWPAQFVQALKEEGYTCYKPDIVAATGWRTDDLKKNIESAGLPKDYNLVSLLIGVNNQYQGKTADSYAVEFESLLSLAIQYAGGDPSKVFVLSIPDYGYTSFGQGRQPKISSDINAFNAINKSISEKLGITYIDITDISRQGLMDPSLIANDGLHPSGKMYGLWVSRVLETIR